MRHAAIDLSAYPPPDAIDGLDYEAELAARKAALLASYEARNPTPAELADLQDILQYEYEPIVGLLEADAYRDTTFTARVNDKVRAVMLATATGTDLDHIAATYYRVTRRVITPADPSTGTAAVMEDDQTFRQRIALSPESWSAAGPEGAYLFFGLTASGDVLDIAVYSEDDGACLAPGVRAAILSRLNDGSPATPDLIATVKAALNRREIRPIGDKVTVETVTLLPYQIAVTLQVRPGSSSDLIRAAALKKIAAYTSGRIRWAGDDGVGPVWLIGRRIRLSTLAAAARVDGVEEVIITSPVADINAPAQGYAAALPIADNAVAALAPALTAHLFIAPICTGVTVTIETIAEGWTS